MQLDPVTLEIMNNKFLSIANEMSFTLMRAGRTLYVKETADFSTALVDLDGKFFAYPDAIGVAGFVDLDCSPTIRAVGELEPGDVIFTNHPYESQGLCTHTPDLHIIVPYFYDGEIVCYGWSFLHSADVGGKVPCSISPSSYELFQEGLAIPPVKCRRAGEWDETFLRIFRTNCRTPEENVGDLQAMFAAHKVGQDRISEVIEQHGVHTFLQAHGAVIDYAARKARTVLRQVPNGVYEFWDYLDDDMVSPVPVRIRLKMTFDDGKVDLDFTGTDPQVMAAFNVPTGGHRHAWLTLAILKFVYTIDPTVPLNHGVFHSITATAPKGCIVNPEYPAAVGVRHATSIRIFDVIVGALAQAVPELVPACAGGIVIPVVLAERDPDTGHQDIIVVEPMIGGTGASNQQDGIDGRDSSISNLSNNPIETVEASSGAIFSNYALRRDSGGAGKWRGGVGLELTFEIAKDGAQVLGRGMERLRFRPWGLCGGKAGLRARTILNRGTPQEQELGRIDMLHLSAGDQLTVLTPGGGGYGDPFERELSAVLDDYQRDLISTECAEQDYGVVIRDAAIDEDATARLRNTNTKRGNGALYNFGSEREAWEVICTDQTMTRLAESLCRIPLAVRGQTRKQFFERMFPDLEAVGIDIGAAVRNVERLKETFQKSVDRFTATEGMSEAD